MIERREIYVADYSYRLRGSGRSARLFVEGSKTGVSDPKSSKRYKREYSRKWQKKEREQKRALEAAKKNPGVFGFMASQLKR